MTATLLAAAAGAAGGLGHLGLVALRAHLATHGRPALSLVLGPIGWLFPLGAAALVIALAPGAAWAVLVGLILARTAVLAHIARRG